METSSLLELISYKKQIEQKINWLEEFLLKNLIEISNFEKSEKVLDCINFVSKFKIKDKAGEFIGTRMGRPEKAKLRKLQGSPNVLFPVGIEGGRLRSLQAACEVGKVRGDFPIFHCETCNKETIYNICDIPPLNQFDATATLLQDFFTDKPDYTPYSVEMADRRIFDPQKALDPYDRNFRWESLGESPEIDNEDDFRASHSEQTGNR